MKFMFIRDHAQEFPIVKMAKVLKVCRSGYYAFINREPGKRELENQRLLKEIEKTHKKSREIYGSPRIHRQLKKNGEKCSRKRVARIMKKEKIQSKTRRKWIVTTQPSKSKIEAAPNHLNQNFTTRSPNQVWTSDITYVETKEGWLYVAVVLDVFSRKIVGLSMGETLQTELVIKALRQALYHRNPKKKLTHHSDRGCQYTSKEFKKLADHYQIILSMSAKGRCYDNAVTESFFHTLKTEHVYLHSFKTREEAKNSIFEYIEVFYNRERTHSTIEYMSPEDFEKEWEEEMNQGIKEMA